MKIETKQLNKITLIEFYEKDIAVSQEGHYVLLDKAEILELAEKIQLEKLTKEFSEHIKESK